MNHIRICSCCDNSLDKLVKTLNGLTKEEVATYTERKMKKSSPNATDATIQGMINIILNPPNKLGESSKNLVKQCINFLLFDHIEKTVFPKKNQNDFHKNKYITIWSFILDYLKITANSGFDYFLMAYLDTYNYLEHGSGIRCGWLNTFEGSNEKKEDYFEDYINKVISQNNEV